jgi:hypothetical protein
LVDSMAALPVGVPARVIECMIPHVPGMSYI